MPNPVVHFEILGRDAKKLHGFYAGLFGWKVDANNEFNYGMVDTQTPGKGIAGGIGPSMDGSARVAVYAEVPDLQAAIDKAVSLGGTVLMPVTDVPGGPTVAMVADPEGNAMGLIKARG